MKMGDEVYVRGLVTSVRENKIYVIAGNRCLTTTPESVTLIEKSMTPNRDLGDSCKSTGELDVELNIKDLKSCPFCDGEAILYYSPIGEGIWKIRCSTCSAEVTEKVFSKHDISYMNEAKDKVIDKWNTRKGAPDFTEDLTHKDSDKEGKWVVNKYGQVECNKCHSLALSVETGCAVNRHMEQYKTNFCPNCGKDMRGE